MALDFKTLVIPESSGCYLYKDESNKVIYVGKAKNLRKRVMSYYTSALNYKNTKLFSEIVDVEFFITKNEKEALILEENLIKKYKPRYNILLNDDKHYPYIVITKEQDPEYQYVRAYKNIYKKSFGPLPDGSSALKLLKVLQLLYPLRRCKGNLGKPCIYYGIEQCSGACFKAVSNDYYNEKIEKVDSFFKNDSSELEEKLKSKMMKASENLQFEEAGRIKNLLSNLNMAFFKQSVELDNQMDINVFNFATLENKVCFVTLFYLKGKLSFIDNLIFEYENEFEIDEMFKSYISQVLKKNKLPEGIVIPNKIDIDDFNLFNEAETKIQNDNSLLNLAKKNAEEYLKINIIKSFSFKNKNSELLEELKTITGLKKSPYHIEMFDVANLADEFITGAMVVFKNGFASRNDFRKYNISSEMKSDYHRMQEMIYRRYQKDLFKKENLPDLIIMDGGTIQINAARSQLEILGINLPIVGLVKDEKHKTRALILEDGMEIDLKKNVRLYNFLSSMQDRVHDFAISSFRNRKQKGIFTNEFEKIPGIGKIGINKIAKSFENVNAIKSMSMEEMTNKLNDKNLAKKLYEHYNNKNIDNK